MDVFERLNRKFGVWYEGLFGGGADAQRELRPRDILRRILAAMEDARREGLDGQVYVPNAYTLQITPQNDDERDYLHTFLDADELAQAVIRGIEQHGYKVRGSLVFTIEELAAPPETGERVRIKCRFDASAGGGIANYPVSSPNPTKIGVGSAQTPIPSTVPAPVQEDDEDDMGTVPAQGTALASLVVRGPDGRLQEVYPLGGRGVRLGRGRQAGNDIVLAGDGMISKQHARIVYEASRFVLYDENSTNGTFLADERLVPGQGRSLEPGDQIRLGATTLLFRPAAVAPTTVAAPLFSAPSAVGFRLVAGDGESWMLASEMNVGRALTADIALAGNGIAAKHARLSTRGESVYVEDLNTPGGTFVNGERIPPQFPVALYEGDQVGFGEILLTLQRGGAPSER